MYLGYIWLYRDSIEKAFLWPDQAQLKAAVTEFLPCADILKLSDEELFFITGKEHIADAVEELFAMGISVILYTKGSQGAEVYTRTAHVAVSGSGKKAVDTTGAGDGFIGSFLNQLAYEGRTLDDMKKMTDKEWESYLIFSNRYCGESIQKKRSAIFLPYQTGNGNAFWLRIGHC